MESPSRIDIDEFVNEKNIFNKQLFLNLRRMVLQAAPNMNEVVKWNMPVYEFEGKKICSINIYRDHLNLEFFIGARLRDPTHSLDGTGKELRHLKVYDRRDLNNQKIVSFIKQSIALL